MSLNGTRIPRKQINPLLDRNRMIVNQMNKLF